jgi:hypothetical protein
VQLFTAIATKKRLNAVNDLTIPLAVLGPHGNNPLPERGHLTAVGTVRRYPMTLRDGAPGKIVLRGKPAFP